MKVSNFIKCDNWYPLRAGYLILGDIDDDDALWDNLEYFETWPWFITIDEPRLICHEYAPLGAMYIKVPKWKCEQVERALENYGRRMAWKHKNYREYCENTMKILKEARDDS